MTIEPPLPAAPPTPTPGATPSGAGGGVNPLAVLAGLPKLNDPTMRPDEPLTAGLPIGPGPGPPPGQESGAVGLVRSLIAGGQGDPEMFELLDDLLRTQRR
jgi:hypothetical protein